MPRRHPAGVRLRVVLGSVPVRVPAGWAPGPPFLYGQQQEVPRPGHGEGTGGADGRRWRQYHARSGRPGRRACATPGGAPSRPGRVGADLAGLHPPDVGSGHRRGGLRRRTGADRGRDRHPVVVPGRAADPAGHAVAVPAVRPGGAGQVRAHARRVPARPAARPEPGRQPVGAGRPPDGRARDPPPVRLRGDPPATQPGAGRPGHHRVVPRASRYSGCRSSAG